VNASPDMLAGRVANAVIYSTSLERELARLRGVFDENEKLRSDVARLTTRPKGPHSEVVDLLDRLRGHAKVFGPKVKADFEAVTDSIESLTRAYMLPEVAYDWEIHRLSRIQQRLAEFLRLRFGRVCTREQICNGIYAGRVDDAPGPDIVDVFVCQVRQKLRDTDCPYGIKSAWGEGYLMTDRESADQSMARSFIAQEPTHTEWRGFKITQSTLPMLQAMEQASPAPISMDQFINKHGRNSVNVRLHHLRRRLAGRYEIKLAGRGCYSLREIPSPLAQALKAA
jgi:DNA-binding winged helix-turn-helix (wHTH) protein